MIVMLVHGFNDVTAGKGNIDKCEPYLNELGYAVDTDGADYGFFNLWKVRFWKRSAVCRMVKAINSYPSDQEVAIICYSNGANYTRKVLPHLHRKVKVIFCSAAVNHKAKFHENMLFGWNFFIRNDFIVRLSRLLFFLPWGKMGATRYTGPNKNIVSIDYTDVASGHGGMFKDGVIDIFVHQVHRLLSEGAPK